MFVKRAGCIGGFMVDSVNDAVVVGWNSLTQVIQGLGQLENKLTDDGSGSVEVELQVNIPCKDDNIAASKKYYKVIVFRRNESEGDWKVTVNKFQSLTASPGANDLACENICVHDVLNDSHAAFFRFHQCLSNAVETRNKLNKKHISCAQGAAAAVNQAENKKQAASGNDAKEDNRAALNSGGGNQNAALTAGTGGSISADEDAGGSQEEIFYSAKVSLDKANSEAELHTEPKQSASEKDYLSTEFNHLGDKNRHDSAAEVDLSCAEAFRQNQSTLIQVTECLDFRCGGCSEKLTQIQHNYFHLSAGSEVSAGKPVLCVPFVRMKGWWFFKKPHYAVAVNTANQTFVVGSADAYSKPIKFVKLKNSSDNTQPHEQAAHIVSKLCESASAAHWGAPETVSFNGNKKARARWAKLDDDYQKAVAECDKIIGKNWIIQDTTLTDAEKKARRKLIKLNNKYTNDVSKKSGEKTDFWTVHSVAALKRIVS